MNINLRQRFSCITEPLQRDNVLELNDEELPVLARLFALAGNASAQLIRLAQRFDLRAVSLTKGAQRSSLLIDGVLISRPSSALRVVDTVGAGDSYSAALLRHRDSAFRYG